MLNVFILASDLGLSGMARQLSLTLPALPCDRIRVEVGVLGEAGAAAEALRDANIPVHRLPLRYPLDVKGIRHIQHSLNRLDPEILHVVGPGALRASYLLRHRKRFVSGASSLGGGFLGWATALWLRRSDRILCYSEAEAARYRTLKVAEARLTRLTPAVGQKGDIPLFAGRPRKEECPLFDPTEFHRSIGVPANARLILAGGRLDRTAGLKDAVWAFDILKYESNDFYLVLVGEGPDRARLEAFGKALGFDDYRVRFAGERPDLPALFALTEVVWVTHERGGMNIALEAMAAGRPVLGWKNADLAAFISDGENGLLLPRGDRIALAAKTRAVLEDKALAARLGAAGRKTAAVYDVSRAAERLAAVYETAALPTRPKIPDN